MKFDVVIIGSGPGGYVAAIRAAQLGLKVACIDKRKEPGGTCLNVGCIPSKTLLHSSEMHWKMNPPFDFSKMMEQKRKVISGFNEGILGLFKKNQITYLPGQAKITAPHTVQVSGETIEAKNIILATGSEPAQLPFLPFDEKRIVSSTGALAFEKIPSRLCVIGAGIIGVELGSVYHRLGSQVTFIEFQERICPTLDESLSKELQTCLTKQGMTFHLNTKVTGADIASKEITLRTEKQELKADAVLIAIGRKPYTQNLGLETVGIVPTAKGFIPIDGQFRTSVPHIFALGDLVDGPMLAHKASEEGVAVAELIAGKTPTIEYLAIPSVVYTYPEVASVGMTEAEAKSFNLSYKTGQFPFKANSRARSTGEEEGFVKILAESTTDRILGVHIISAHASELIALPTLAIQKKLTALDLAHTPFAHPTFSEAIKEAALAVHQRAIHR
jgi:dihydrolipoamide dehydrogenase